MKIIAFSDPHGQLPVISSEFNLMLIAGDLSPGGGFKQQKEWWLNEFISWFNGLSLDVTSKILITPGNHDEESLFNSNTFLTELCQKTNNQVKILIDEEYIYSYLTDGGIGSIKVYGTPWCHQFGNWSFMRGDNIIRDFFEKIPNNVDILLTHDAPYGCSDICYEGRSAGKHVGSVPLMEAVINKKPKMCLHGHLHTSNHDPMFLEGTCVMNVSLLNESYMMTYKPLVFDKSYLEHEINSDLNDEEYVFPNRFDLLIRLRKTGCDYTLDIDPSSYMRLGYEEDGKINYIDPEGGPWIQVGQKWFDFVIESIREFEGKYIFTLNKDGISS